MMKKYDEILSDLKLPKFVLFKNLSFEHDFDIDASVSRGDLIKSDFSYESLKTQIPKPVFPTDEYKISLLDSKYGQVTEENLEYDDTVYDLAEGDPNDYEIFGESYTVIFLCPPGEDYTIDYLIEQYKKERDLVNIWVNYVDRIHIFPFYSLEKTSDRFLDDLGEKFRDKVSQIQQPPTQEEWDELSEYL